ncbi:MAG: short-chain dehydrogenase, partial [Candidatus Pelagibacter sp.]
MKNILITGSSKRIGAEFVKFFYKKNFNVALHYNKSKSQAIKLGKLLGYKKNRIIIVKGDLSSEQGAKKIFFESKKKLGKITHLINCASVFENDDIKNFNSSKWSMNMNINLRAPYILTSEFSKQKFNKKNQGNIINIIDQRVFNLTPFFFSYTLSKVALYNLTITSAMRLAPYVRVNGIAPGPVIKNLRQNKIQFKKQYINTLLQ